MLPADILERYDDVSNEALASWTDEDACECGGLFNGYDPWLVKCDTCERLHEVDRSRAMRLLYDCSSAVASENDQEFYRLVVFGDADYSERAGGKLAYKLTASGKRCAEKAWRPMNYIERKRALAEALGVDQEDCRAHDKTNLWAYKIAGQRKEGEVIGMEKAAGICEQQSEVFSSDEYAVGQPLSSVSERTACASCAAAIRESIDAE